MAKLETRYLILIVSAAASLLLVITSTLVLEMTTIVMAYLAVIVIALLMFPYTFYQYMAQARLNIIEEQFPIFLKDISDSLRAGLTMIDSIKTASKSDYREFNSEIRRMSNQMSWGLSFEKVIEELIVRLKKSVYMSRGLAILLQSYKSGGDISPIMTSVADSTVLLQNVEKDQRSSMSEQTAIIYVIQLVFIIITVVLFRVLIPITSAGGFGEAIIGGQVGNLDTDYYKGFFFITIVIQSVCNGLVAGVTGSGSLLAGVRHVAIMFSVSLILFTLFILPKILQVNAITDKYTVAGGEEIRILGTVNYDDDYIINTRVDIIVLNSTFTGFTDESGEYDITVTAPSERGEVNGLVRVEYEGNTAEAEFGFSVR